MEGNQDDAVNVNVRRLTGRPELGIGQSLYARSLINNAAEQNLNSLPQEKDGHGLPSVQHYSTFSGPRMCS